MKCHIDKYEFSLNENSTISVYQKSGLTLITTFKPDKQISSQKDFEIECSDWYIKSLRY